MSRSIVLSVLIVTLFLAVLLAVVAPGFVQAELDSAVIAGELDEDEYDDTLASQESLSEANSDSVTLELVPQGDTKGHKGTPVTFDIVVWGATDGISSFDVRFELTGDADAAFISAELNRTGFSDTAISDDGPQVQLVAALGDDTYDPAEKHTLGNVTAVGYEPGSVEVHPLDDPEINDLNGSRYATETSPSEFTTTEGLDVNMNGQAATDTAGDGLLDDVTGDGSFTIVDVQALFEHRNRPVVQRYSDRFDFSGFDATEITIFDVQALFNRLSAMSG